MAGEERDVKTKRYVWSQSEPEPKKKKKKAHKQNIFKPRARKDIAGKVRGKISELYIC